MDSDVESSLINKLQSSDLHQIYQLFFDYLHPFTDLIPLTTAPKSKKSKKPSSTAEEDNHRSTIRSLAKKFLPFLNRSLSLIPKRLSETPNFDEQIGLQLFRTYKLCLNCLECVSSQLSCKPYSVQIQRVRLIHCFEAWGRYRDAQDEGFSTLESFQGIEIGGKGLKAVRKGKYVPGLGKESVDSDFALLVVEIVVTLVKCVAMSQSKEEEDYRRVMVLVDEVTPWFRVLDASTYEKLHRAFVTYLNKCTLFLVGELMDFKEDLVRGLCSVTFAENSKSVMKDQLQKFARRICSSLFSQKGDQSSSIMGILTCILDYMVSECKVEMERTTTEFLELICYCANKCRTSSRVLCSSLATYLSKLGESCQVSSPFDLILRLYVTGLFVSDCYGQSRQDNSISTRNMHDGCVMAVFLDKEDVLHNLAVLLDGLKRHFPISSKDISLPIDAKYNYSVDFVCQTHPHIKSNYEDSRVCKMKNGKSYMLSYCNALKFLCQPLADFVNSARKEIVAEIEGVSFPTKLRNIQDAFHQFCDVFIFCHRAFEQESNAFDDCEKSIVSVAVASLTLSFRTRHSIKESQFIKQVISVDWIQANGLKYLFASLHNVGVALYRNKQVKEASKALNLCCRASWTCVSYLCESFANRTNRFCNDDVSQEDVTNFISDACAKSAFLLDVLYQCDSHNKLTRIMEYSLQNWSATENVFNRLPSPIALVKQWVKIECKLFKHQNTECSGTTLYSLVSSSAKMSKRSLGIILEQELLAYNEMSALNPRLCQKMQMDIIGLLLSKVYVTHDSFLQKSKILVAKGRELRACGMEGLNGCIECLSEAISTILSKHNEMSGETVRQSITVRHQLALAYSLRAMCIQEAEPNSKKPFQDVCAALNLWLSPDFSLADDHCDMVGENMLIVLYHLVDMLSIKGYTEFQHDLCELLIRLFKRNNVPLEKCLALLWQYRRLGHALCVSPVSDGFIATLSQHCDKFESIDFWTSCMNGSLPLEVGFQLCFSFMFSSFFCGSSQIMGSFRPDIKVDEVKQAASDLISCVSPCSGSVFLAAHLYHDLCGKLISNGQLIEALAYAKEAHRLRSKLLQEKFRYSVERQSKICDENGENIHKSFYNLSIFQMYSSVATAVWSRDNNLCDLEGCILTPWNILQCYLESTLQVGIIHELIGNGSEAETLLLWGKDISTFQGLPIFKIAFSSVLGILYRKQRLWDLAEKELQYAKQILADCCTTISCLKCRLLFAGTIDLHLGDLFRSRLDNETGKLSVKSLWCAETLYKSALNKLTEWGNSVSNREEISVEKTIVCDALASEVGICASSLSARAPYQSDIINEFPSEVDVLGTRIEAKKSRKAKKASKPLPQGLMTRSRYHSQRNNENIPCEVHVGLPKYSNNAQCVAFPNFLGQRGPVSEIKSSAADLRCEIACVCNNMKCWYCLPIEVMKSGCINNFVQIKWEFARRRLLLRLLAGRGKCMGALGEIHKAHEILLQSISVLVSRNLSSPYSSVPQTTLLDLIGRDIPGDPLAVERAAILYSLCWFTLKSYPSRGTRINCCDMNHIQTSRIISWLMLAFILCREVPILVQKVSRLLAAIFVLSASTDFFSPYLSPCKELSESHWASYFHQASLGTHLNHKLLSSLIGKQKDQDPMNVKGSCLTGSSSIASERLDLLRLAPGLLQDLEGYVLRFFQCLPCTTIVCISLLGGDFASLLTELLNYRSCAHAWILLSRFNSNSQPVVILVPVESVLEEGTEDDTNSGSGILFEDKSHGKHWHCPWGSTVVDQVAPEFRMILKENYLTSSMHPLEDTKMNRSIWWMQRKNLDQRLSNFLRDLEDSWFGPWKYLLLGELSGSKHQELVQRKLMHNLKVKCKVDAHESLLNVVVGGAKHACEREECVLQLILSKGCFIGGVGNFSQTLQGTLADTCDGDESLSKMAFNLILEASKEVEEQECLNREPVILVLDFDVQMLPWENLPVLRNQEVYRMPSISSISATLDRYCRLQEQVGSNSAIIPLIDPLDAFYLLNPSGDLSSTQIEFEDYFREKNLEGKAGTAATIEELAVALRSRDLFLYFGHGSGAQYIPEHEIQKLENCAATLLMGCSSGSLSLNGCYTPQGAPLSYLLAGSPVIIANLWEVTDKDIDRFGKAMLDCCLKERLTASTGCVQCNLVAEKFKSVEITGTKGIAKKKTSRKKIPEDVDIGTPTECCNHRPKIGSFMGQAREACTLPFLIGASPVCYGVPTGISKKKEL
ncbi:LOW QUALITY PROTEIN: separase-like [Actinidia eriantha]|uniref:LOW QUALITY PROTEIN: separase-like n=1 Tax=Actinidia eriantha TaxID=165200 RepID=UPI002584AB51|nr:LOW QUALITY PROTEIN: separase-like [Actinidia eriantha]